MGVPFVSPDARTSARVSLGMKYVQIATTWHNNSAQIYLAQICVSPIPHLLPAPSAFRFPS